MLCISQDRERKRQKLADEAADAYIGAGDLTNGGGGASVVSPADEEPVKPQVCSLAPQSQLCQCFTAATACGLGLGALLQSASLRPRCMLATTICIEIILPCRPAPPRYLECMCKRDVKGASG